MKKNRAGLAAMIGEFRRAFVALGAFSCAVNLLLLVPALYMLQIYDRVLASRNEVTLLMLTLIMVGLLMLMGALEIVRAKVLVRVGAALDLAAGPRIFDAAFERHLAGHRGNSGQPLNDLATVRQFLTGKGLFAFFDAPWTPLFVAVIYLLHPWLGAFALASALLLFGLAYLNERATGPALGEAGRLSSSANHYAASNLRNAEVVHAMGMLPRLRERWLARQGRFLALQAEGNERGALVGSVTKFFRLTLQSAILGLGALLVIEHQLTPGGMIAASILLARALSPVDLAIGTWRSLVAARGAYERLNALLAAHPPRAAGTALPRPEGAVALENLVLGAPGSRSPILKGLSFRVAPGTIVAVMGPSAAGKSTLARALVGVWTPMSGAVRLDGADVARWDKEELGPWIGYVPQDVELFDGTVAENIARFGALDSEKIVEAARRAGVHEMVLRLPEGYDTVIGEAGAVLSAGQRQRVALARALYGEPALIVLDEPNANLDEAGDEHLLAALHEMKAEKRTVFLMTHRRNVLSVADSVLVLAGGIVRAYGPRDKVLKALPRTPLPPATPSEEAA